MNLSTKQKGERAAIARASSTKQQPVVLESSESDTETDEEYVSGGDDAGCEDHDLGDDEIVEPFWNPETQSFTFD